MNFRKAWNLNGKKAEVPEYLRNAAEYLCLKYKISGICDPMYIANVLAYSLCRGDGQSNFDMRVPTLSTELPLVLIAATSLLHAYESKIRDTIPNATKTTIAADIQSALLSQTRPKASDFIIKVGDVVEILNPLFIKRVGYKLHPADLYEDIATDPATSKALDDLGIKHDLGTARFGFAGHPKKYDGFANSREFEAFVRAVAVLKTVQANFGGNTRELIYRTEDLSEYQNKRVRVIGKRVAKSGTRFPPSGGVDAQDGEYWYCPGGLTDCKTHVLLSIEYLGVVIPDANTLEIEACHVRKIV
jgi:hypothetical protein